MMHTILGAGGAIAVELAKSLPLYQKKVRLVSRHPKAVVGSEELVVADLLNAAEVDKAVEGSEVVYLVAGLPYNYKVWQVQWPLIMQNVINACRKSKSKLVFFDNVYAYGKVDGWMTEQTPYNAISKKGQVRKRIAEMLMHEVEMGHLDALIARAPDFYGPLCNTSFLNMVVMARHLKGQKAQWMANAKVPHSFIFTPDAGKATALLGNTESAFNQVWHLPTAKPALTGEQWAEMSAAATGAPNGVQVLPLFMIRVLGLFIGPLRESVELIYQNDSPYLFDSTKFEKAFSYSPMPYGDGLKATLEAMRAAK
jgi:nucleoside-diphosphate-sugar epimerase